MADKHLIEIDCKHGKGIASIVCHHLLVKDRSLGFIENASDPEDLQGWCYDCETFFLEEGDMTEAFLKFTKGTVVCEKCYAELKAYHELT